MGWAFPHPQNTLHLGVAEDWRAWQDLESCTVEVRRRAAPAADGTARLDAGDVFAVTAAKKRSLSKRELTASQGAYTGEDRVWLLPSMLLPAGRSPKPGDVVIDTHGHRWTALEAGLNRLGHTWRLVCRDLVLHFDLCDLITIEKPVISHGEAGWPVKEFEGAYPGLRARVQPQRMEYMEQRGIEGPRTRYDVIVEREIAVTTEGRVKWGEVYLEIRGYRNAERIDELPVIECEHVP